MRSRSIRCMLLYDSPVSGNCYKVRLLLAHLGVAYERRTVDVVDRSDRPELLGELNPAQRVPTLVLDDGRSLAESGAILWFFGEGTRFVPDGSRTRERRCCSGCSSSSTTTSPRSPSRASGSATPGRPEEFETASRRADGGRLPRARRDGAASRRARLARRRRDDPRRHRALRVHARRGRGRFRARSLSRDRRWLDRVAAQPGHVTIDA